MAEVLKIAVVDDHPLVRDGVAHIIDRTPGYEVVAQGETASDALRIVDTVRPDILVLDLSIPGGGAEALRRIKETPSQTRVMILTVSDSDDDVFEVLALGAKGYVLKGTTGDELIHAIRMLAQGEQYITPSLAARILMGVGQNKHAQAAPSLENLSGREREISILVGKGLSNKIIGGQLDLSEKTVKHYLTIIFRKTNSPNRAALALWVLKQALSDKRDPS